MKKYFILALSVLIVSLNIDAKTRPYPTKDTLYILAIGNSFSQDAIEQNLYELFKADGQEVVVGNMYIGGCTLERHLGNIKNDIADYEYREVVGGVKTNTKNARLSQVLPLHEWDYVSVQQASGKSGLYETVTPYLQDILEYVDSTVTGSPKILWHQTWAYSKDSDHGEFPNYGRDQMQMYEAIVGVWKSVMDDYGIDILVPSGTAVQNARTSSLGDTLNRDGYHLELTYGRYTAACAWYEAISGCDVTKNSWKPETISDSQARIARKAAHKAVRKPAKVSKVKE